MFKKINASNPPSRELNTTNINNNNKQYNYNNRNRQIKTTSINQRTKEKQTQQDKIQVLMINVFDWESVDLFAFYLSLKGVKFKQNLSSLKEKEKQKKACEWSLYCPYY